MHRNPSTTQRRRSLRRAVHLDCAVVSDLWTDSAPHLATDLSPEGVWLCSELPLEPGTEVVVSFRPPRWPWKAPPLTTLAEVARVGMPRRRDDQARAGMGLSFVAMDDGERERLTTALCGLPPPLPGYGRLTPPGGRDETILVVDGVEASFVAEGALLGGGRSPRALTLPSMRPSTQVLPRLARSYRYRPPLERAPSAEGPTVRTAPAASLRPPLYLVSADVA